MTQYKPYRPQYKEMNITPVQYAPRQVPAEHQPQTNIPLVAAFSSKRRENQSVVPPINVPYAEVGQTTPQLVNVGNNIDNGWSSVGNLTTDANSFGMVEDTTSVDPNHPMIDNNFDAFARLPLPQPMRPAMRVEAAPAPVAEPQIPNIGEYVLLVSGETVAIGSTKQIQDAAWSLLTESEVLPDDIMVMKRVDMNIGVFLSE